MVTKFRYKILKCLFGIKKIFSIISFFIDYCKFKFSEIHCFNNAFKRYFRAFDICFSNVRRDNLNNKDLFLFDFSIHNFMI